MFLDFYWDFNSHLNLFLGFNNVGNFLFYFFQLSLCNNIRHFNFYFLYGFFELMTNNGLLYYFLDLYNLLNFQLNYFLSFSYLKIFYNAINWNLFDYLLALIGWDYFLSNHWDLNCNLANSVDYDIAIDTHFYCFLCGDFDRNKFIYYMLDRFLNENWYLSVNWNNLSLFLTDNDVFRSIYGNASFKGFCFID